MKSVYILHLFENLNILTMSSIWLWFRTGGPLLGEAIVLGLNQ